MPSHGFSESAQNALRTAQEIVQQKRHSQLDVEHMLLALLRPQRGRVAAIIQQLHADPQELARRVEAALDSNSAAQTAYTGLAQIHISMRAQRVVSAAPEWVARLGSETMGVEHLLLAILAEQGGASSRLLAAAGIDPAGVQAALHTLRAAGQPSDDLPPMTVATSLDGGFSVAIQADLRTAQGYAQQSGHDLDVEHILLALLNPRDGLASRIIEHLGGDPQKLYRDLAASLQLQPQAQSGGNTSHPVHLSRRVHGVIAAAAQVGGGAIGVEQLLVAIAAESREAVIWNHRQPSVSAAQLLLDMGIDPTAIQIATRAIQSSLNDQPHAQDTGA